MTETAIGVPGARRQEENSAAAFPTILATTGTENQGKTDDKSRNGFLHGSGAVKPPTRCCRSSLGDLRHRCSVVRSSDMVTPDISLHKTKAAPFGSGLIAIRPCGRSINRRHLSSTLSAENIATAVDHSITTRDDEYDDLDRPIHGKHVPHGQVGFPGSRAGVDLPCVNEESREQRIGG